MARQSTRRAPQKIKATPEVESLALMSDFSSTHVRVKAEMVVCSVLLFIVSWFGVGDLSEFSFFGIPLSKEAPRWVVEGGLWLMFLYFLLYFCLRTFNETRKMADPKKLFADFQSKLQSGVKAQEIDTSEIERLLTSFREWSEWYVGHAPAVARNLASFPDSVKQWQPQPWDKTLLNALPQKTVEQRSLEEFESFRAQLALAFEHQLMNVESRVFQSGKQAQDELSAVQQSLKATQSEIEIKIARYTKDLLKSQTELKNEMGKLVNSIRTMRSAIGLERNLMQVLLPFAASVALALSHPVLNCWLRWG